MNRRIVLLAALFTALGAFGATQAQANIYCAGSALGPCDSNYYGSTTAVQAAVAAAEANPGPDTVKIGPGNFTTPTANGDFELFSSGTNNTLNIVGEDALSSTVLSVQNTDQQSIIFDAGDGSTMSNLGISIPGAGGGTALWARNSQGGTPPVVHDVNVYKANASNNPVNITGVVLQNGGSLVNSSVDVTSANFTTAVSSQGAGSQTVLSSYLRAYRVIHQATTGGNLTVSRSSIVPTNTPGTIGALNEDGTLNLRDSWIKMPKASQGYGVETFGTSGFTDTQIDGSTISGGAFTKGAWIKAEGLPTSSSRLQLDNTVIAVGGPNIDYYGGSGGNTVTVKANYAAYNTSKVLATNISTLGTFNYDPQNVIDIGTVDPKFVDAADDDYELTSTSPLIDAGQPIDPPVGSMDRESSPRACQGNGSGVIRRDMGAFEYRNGADDCTYPVASITGPATTTVRRPSFGISSSKPGSTFECSIFEGVWAACGGPSFAPPVDLDYGAHTLKVRATDSFGNVQQMPTEKAFTVEKQTCANTPSLCPKPPTCKTDPSLCPPDKVKPVVKGLKAPKKTRAKKVKVRFRSNEAGSTFRCRLNRGKAKKCKSPWKTPKLRKGFNRVTVIATDKAGNVSKPAKVKIKRRK